MTGSSARILALFVKLCGERQLRNVLIVTTRWGDVAQNVGVAREKELREKYFQPLLSKGAQMVRHQNNTPAGARQIVENFLSNKKLGRPMALQIQVEIVDNGKRLAETEAGLEVTLGLTELMKRHERDSIALSKGIEDTIRKSDQVSRRELESEQQKSSAHRKDLEKDMAKLIGPQPWPAIQPKPRASAGLLSRLIQGLKNLFGGSKSKSVKSQKGKAPVYNSTSSQGRPTTISQTTPNVARPRQGSTATRPTVDARPKSQRPVSRASVTGDRPRTTSQHRQSSPPKRPS
ncbi:hypothetical protein PQX77_013687 [Marasmius sp. AFHP31]|nr:hypothetical protein PQX77_013687 [Marasmius sp. AFHP31]